MGLQILKMGMPKSSFSRGFFEDGTQNLKMGLKNHTPSRPASGDPLLSIVAPAAEPRQSSEGRRATEFGGIRYRTVGQAFQPDASAELHFVL
jgi:hypothetical protein